MDDNSFRHYLTNIEEKDAEHRAILYFLRQCITACKEGNKDWANDRFLRVMGEWKSHCEKEEKFMMDIRFPFVKAHQDNHVQLDNQLTKIYKNGCSEFAVIDLQKAIIDHIDHFDLQYADWYKKHKQ